MISWIIPGLSTCLFNHSLYTRFEGWWKNVLVSNKCKVIPELVGLYSVSLESVTHSYPPLTWFRCCPAAWPLTGLWRNTTCLVARFPSLHTQTERVVDTGQSQLVTKKFLTTFLEIQRVFYPPVVSNDGSGQHTCEQPTKLSQGVKEGSVVCFHIGALGKHNICPCKSHSLIQVNWFYGQAFHSLCTMRLFGDILVWSFLVLWPVPICSDNVMWLHYAAVTTHHFLYLYTSILKLTSLDGTPASVNKDLLWNICRNVLWKILDCHLVASQ